MSAFSVRKTPTNDLIMLFW